MSAEIRTLDPNTIGKLVLDGDLKGLTPSQRVDYYSYRCQQAGLDPAAKPFDLLTLNGKMILYANAGCTQQLKAIHGLSSEILKTELVDDVFCVHTRIKGPDGRFTDQMGAVCVGGLKGEQKANAHMKAYTKADRRGVLSHCGLGMLDETEAETAPEWVDAKPEAFDWTDEARATAKAALADLGQILMDFGVSEEDQKPILAKPAEKIGDPDISLDKFLNQLFAYSQRQLAKFKPQVPA